MIPPADQGRIVFYTPTLVPVGGVVKIFDYVAHALAGDYRVVVACPEPLESAVPLRDIPHLASALDRIEFHHGSDVALDHDDLVFFSWPEDYGSIVRALPPQFAHRRIVHIIQNIRHANPRWLGGLATRLLGRPMTRIMITDQVGWVCRPWLNPNSITETIIEGHAADHFARSRQGGLPRPIQVGYTTWKSDVGPAVEEALGDDDRFRFRSIRTTAGWSEVRELYHWSDAFLGCPGAEEGFYLVGLEVMAAGSLLIMSDAGGNRAYARWGENCIPVDHDDVDGYVNRLLELLEVGDDTVERMRDAGYATVPRFGLDHERQAFLRLLQRISSPVNSNTTESIDIIGTRTDLPVVAPR